MAGNDGGGNGGIEMRVCKISLKLPLTLGMGRGWVIITITTSDEAGTAALQHTAVKYPLVNVA